MKVYISHSEDDDIAPLRDFLAEEGVSVVDTSNASVSDPISEAVRASIRAADAVLAFPKPEAVEVFFELGIAFGLHKPVLLLVGPGTPVPGFVMGVRYLISGSLDSELVRIGIRKFVDEVKSGTSRPRRPKVPEFSQQVNEHALRKFLVQLRDLRKSRNPSEVERFVADLIRATGITALEEYSGPKDQGVDLAVWSDALDSSLGNPILFQIKAGKLNEQTILQTFDRLGRQVSPRAHAA